MIKVLEGAFERVDYHNNYSVLLHINREYENYPPHWHTATEIIMPLDNIYTGVCGKNTFRLNENDILIIPAGELHELIAPPTGLRLILQFDSSLIRSIHGFSSLMALFGNPKLITKTNSPDIHAKLQEIMLEIRDEFVSLEPLNTVAIYAKIIEFYVKIARKSIKADNLFPDVKIRTQQEYVDKFYVVFEYLNTHYNENITLDSIAEVAGFSKFHFSRLFKQFTDQSFNDYLNQKRIKESESLLLKPGLSIADIAKMTGFTSMSTFNRVFRSFKGCTPTEFKILYRNKIPVER